MLNWFFQSICKEEKAHISTNILLQSMPAWDSWHLSWDEQEKIEGLLLVIIIIIKYNVLPSPAAANLTIVSIETGLLCLLSIWRNSFCSESRP